MSIKLVALDLDHTLLNDDKLISSVDLNMINKARSLGVHFTIATGRMFTAAMGFGQYLKIDIPIITYQGSLIKTLMTKEEILHLRIGKEIALEAIDFATKEGIHCNIYNGDKLYVAKENKLTERYRKVNKIKTIVEPEIVKKLKFKPTKLVFVDDDTLLLDNFQKRLENLYLPNYDVTRSLPHLLELGNKNATKSRALSFLADKMGVKQCETMAIGDGLNDLDMIEWAGIGVAMGNANNIVKDKADWITSDNNNNGVAKAIEKFIIEV